jgi:hypothetical protein
MRALVVMGLVATAMLAGCQVNPSADTRFSSPIFTDFGDVMTFQDQDRPPYVLSYPDETMFFFPIYSRPRRADLSLRAISCRKASDGTLVVSARVQNLGADIIATREQLWGEVGAFRVVARVTWSGGLQQDVYASLPIPMGVSAVLTLDLGRTHYFAKDVTQIDVLVDPDRIIPDPVRLNNALRWSGTMNPDAPNCDVVRT